MNYCDISIWVVEDNKDILHGIEEIISDLNPLISTSIFSSGEEIIDHVLSHSPPTLVLLDLGLPGISGIQTMIKLKQGLAESKFLVFTIFEDDTHLFEALKYGACGYILKSESPDKIKEAIKEALDNGAPMSKNIAKRVISSFQAIPINHAMVLLTKRENEVLELLAKGLLYKEISCDLGISQNTIKNHLQNIYMKLHVSNRSEAIIKYINQVQ
ncbi:MAG: response regulator transcription factor [Saprospiraceae bacterium]|nr:response regulator transcription factor [Candidatus Brachybacter algidus]MBK8746461.1 response regulator transcription factor [Candidatus Brachybacter algidus]